MRSLPLLLAAAAVGLTAVAAPADAHRGLRMFRQADADKDGKVTRAEFEAARNARFAGIDANKDGALEVSELRAWKRTWPSRVRDARFKALDADGDGKVGAEEFVARRKTAFADIDANKDGAVDKAEFDAAFEKFRSRFGGGRWKYAGRPWQWRKRKGYSMEQRLDLNRDGKVTRAEFDALGRMIFLRLDGDGDGAVTRKEMRTAYWRFVRRSYDRESGR